MIGFGLAAGGVFLLLILVWGYGRRQLQSLTWQMESALQQASQATTTLRQELQEKTAQLTDLQSQYMAESSRRAVLEERASRVPILEAQTLAQHQELNQIRIREAELLSSLEYERQQAAEKIKILDENQEKLSQTFRSLSAEALSANNQSFLHLAKSTLERFQEMAKTDLSQRQNVISDMLTPVHQALLKVDGKIHDLEKQRIGAYEVLRQQVTDLILSQKELRFETSNLVKALRAPTVRGQWGEMQLKRVVEMAGMISHCDFVEQVSTSTENGRMRPDMIINLPGGKKLIVDAKAPLAAYLESLEAPDETTRGERLQDHARQVRNHIRMLSQRAYWEQFQPTPEFVILFLPGETFFSAALEKDPSLIEVGVKEKVILATPTTLIALLRAVSYGWRQENIAENAKAISDLGRDLYKRLGDMGGHFTRMGRHLGQVVDSYNQTVGTLERRVLVTARKFKELDPSHAELDELSPLDQTPRRVQSAELLPSELSSMDKPEDRAEICPTAIPVASIMETVPFETTLDDTRIACQANADSEVACQEVA